MPRTFSVTRTAHTSASPERVLPLTQDFHAWETWSPWEGLDPDLTRVHTGPERGVGSHYSWDGDRKAGAGSMDMTRCDDDGVELDLVFTRPFAGENHVRIAVTPAADGGSDLAWTMSGPQSRLHAILFRVLRIERMLAKDFDRGLEQLSRRASDRT
ncbi:K(+)-transporting ATPase subunit F [Brachybacterium huguangmaarense]